MRYGVEFLIRDMRVNCEELMNRIREHPGAVASQYGIDEVAVQDIANLNFASLYDRGVHPLSLMKLAVVLGVDLMEQYGRKS